MEVYEKQILGYSFFGLKNFKIEKTFWLCFVKGATSKFPFWIIDFKHSHIFVSFWIF